MSSIGSFRVNAVAAALSLLASCMLGPVLSSPGFCEPGRASETGDVAWEYTRMLGDDAVDHGFLTIETAGVVVELIEESTSGEDIHFGMIRYSPEQLAPPEPNTCGSLPNPDMGDDPYFFAWNAAEGMLCVKQVEEGERWVFRVGDLVVEKHRPVDPGEKPEPLRFHYINGGIEITTGGFEVTSASMGSKVCDGDDGLPISQFMYLGAAMDERELPSPFPAETEWFVADLPVELGVFKIWPLIPGAVLDISIGDREFHFTAPSSDEQTDSAGSV